jgi:hypothetical protein
MPFPDWRFLAIAGAVALAACQHQPPIDMPVAPVNIQRGDTLMLATPLAWPAGDLIFQNERMVAPGAVLREFPYCALSPAGTAPRALSPGPFAVRDVFYDERGSGGPGGANSVTRIVLAAPGGATYALNCGWPAGAPAGGFVSVPQIFNAVGGAFSLGVPK